MIAWFVLATLGAPKDFSPVLAEGWLCHPRRILAKGSAKSIETRARDAGGRVLRRLDEIGYSIVEVAATDLVRAKRHIQGGKGIETVQYDRAARIAYEPNDPLWPDMWHMTAIRANEAWDLHKGDPSVVVAIIDTGVNVAHEDLAANIWVNQDEIPGNNLDDDANGYIDDINGYDFTYGDPNPDDVNGHGTACAGLAAAVQDNLKGGTGVAPRASIMAIKAAQDDGYFYDSATVPAYLYCANNGAKVLSMSYFSDRVSPAERAALDYCVWKGALPVAASGNASTIYPYYPAAYESVLSVAAIGTNLLKAGFSDHGSWVDVAAPGTSLRTSTTSGGYTASFGGTSGACPHVAGLAALVFSANPGLSVRQARSAIEDSATLIDQPPFGEFSNYGLVDCRAALEAALGLTVPAVKPPVVRWADWLPGFTGRGRPRGTTRIYGRGLNRPNVRVSFAGRSVRPQRATRDWLDLLAPARMQSGNLEVWAGADLVATINLPSEPWSVPLREASAPGGGSSVVGGFFATLSEDGTELKCTRRSDGNIVLHGTFRVPPDLDRATLKVARRYAGSVAGTETIRLYDWSTASYPYGAFVTLSTGTPPPAASSSSFLVDRLQDLADDEGIVYFQIVSTELVSGTVLYLDRVVLTPAS